MKLELRKETKLDGEIYYYIYADDTFVRSFYVGEADDPDLKKNDAAKKKQAEEWYDKYKHDIASRPIVEILRSEEIQTNTDAKTIES